MSQKNGTILAVGEGEADVQICFPPNNTSYRVEAEACDPTPVSCNPNDLEYVQVVTTENPRAWWKVILFLFFPRTWDVKFTWNVFATKRIVWSIKS